MTRSEVQLRESLVGAGGDVMYFKGRTGILPRGGLWRTERISLVDGKNFSGGRGGPRAP